MRRFVFDNNVIGHLVDHKDYIQLKQKIEESIYRNINSIYFTGVNFDEFKIGTSEKNLSIFQKYIKEMSILTNSNILFNPLDHIKIPISRADDYFVKILVNGMIKSMRDFIECESYESFQHIFGKYSNTLKETAKKVCIDNENHRDSLVELLRELDNEELRSYLHGKESLEFFNAFLPRIIRNYELDTFLKNMSSQDIINNYSSVKYYSDIVRAFFYKVHFDGKKFKESDLQDIRYIYYLDICDYLVTDDGKLRALLNDSNNEKLIGRAISLENFLNHIDKQCLMNRADYYDSKVRNVRL